MTRSDKATRRTAMRRLMLLAAAWLTAGICAAQALVTEPDSIARTFVEVTEPDSITDAVMEAVEAGIEAHANSLFAPVDSLATDTLAAEVWMPDPSRATWMALAFPGAGQIYNRKYWKLPIVYGGFLGCAYALTWNNQMYSDYSQAFLDIMDDDPATASFADFLPPNYNYQNNLEYLKKVFKSRKDRYRRYRDLSIFSFIGVYLISVVDAYVDAELSHFDISEDLGLHLAPSVIDNSDMYYTMHPQSYGLKCNITF